MVDEFIHEPRVAYFSLEIALRSQIPTYSGGLGVLAGDTPRSAADLELPLVAVSLVSRAGYFRQAIDEAGRQVEHPSNWNPAEWARLLSAKVGLQIDGSGVGRCLAVRARKSSARPRSVRTATNRRKGSRRL